MLLRCKYQKPNGQKPIKISVAIVCAINSSVSIFIPLFVFGLLNTNQFQAIFKREYRIFLKGS